MLESSLGLFKCLIQCTCIFDGILFLKMKYLFSTHLMSVLCIISNTDNDLTFCIRETFANSEDPDEMQYNAAFHQGLQCFG